jgi:SAM-dependent methyltransferase
VTVSGTLRTLLTRLAWLAVAALIAFGSAGVVAAMQHQPGSIDRAELTYAGDQAAGRALDAATLELQALADEVDALGLIARQTLAAVVSGDLDAQQALIAEGTAQLAAVHRQADQYQAAVAAVPGMDTDGEPTVSEALRRRYQELGTVTALTAGLEAEWAAFTGRALDAGLLTGLLTRHDEQTAAAAKEGSAAHYAEALALLDTSDATIAKARALADRLGKAADVATLVTWLDRNATYDASLRNLYQSLVDARGRVTDKVRAAFAAEKNARSLLPEDTRGLIVIMAEVAQGGLNQAVISIEEARGTLAAALDVQAELKAGQSPLPE